jgi:aspartate carbamoyltransferase catalytic subunit
MSEPWTPPELELAEQMRGSDIISVRQFEPQELSTLLGIVERFEGDSPPLLDGRVLAALFFEPSTRTRLSFESAMVRLGGGVVGFADAGISSAAKGETLQDTIRIVESYCDLFVIRHPREGAARAAAEATFRPVINGGDGSNQHPTQTLLDLYTIQRRVGRVTGLRIGFLGDLKYGRAAHSLVEAVAKLGNELVLISPESLRLPKRYVEELDALGVPYEQTTDLNAEIESLDVLYVTRIQQERFVDPLDFERVRNAYQVERQLVDRGKDGLIVMHPLPRVNEIHPNVDDSPRAAYFEQAKNGVTVRKALLALLMGAVG